ncbi:MAG: TonB-dependent receptor [Nitrospira sp.]|nr:TonB-dependent receptor [Nitrospira sp.]MDH4304137.1 TonB-dependent receptor [Nitrospira sp.]MDH5192944.1 TonB-dependent receptor [Nitrospira sp.]
MVDEIEPEGHSPHDRRMLSTISRTLLAIALSATTPMTTQAEALRNAFGQPVGHRIPDELQLLKEEETVSVASRYEQPISQAPSNVYVITDEDIRHSGATDLPTILRRVPGIDVMQVTGADFNVSIRGDNQLNANKLLVMVDGRSIYVDMQGGLSWKNIPVTLPEIKRIEVLKGPASVLYGFNAFDGVVNIITKSPDEIKGTTIQVGGGELGTLSSAAVHAGTHGKLGYRLSFGHDQNDQWRNRNTPAFQNNKVHVRTEYALTDDSRIRLSGGWADANRYDGPVFNLQTPSTPLTQSFADISYERLNFHLRGWWMQNDLNADLFMHPFLNGRLQEVNQFGERRLAFLTNTYNVEAQHSLTLWTNNRLTYGANYRLNTVSGSGVANASEETRFGLYLQDEWGFADRFSVTAGVRYDLNSFINPTISPRVALLYTIAPDHTLRATVSMAYRPPTLFERESLARFVTSLPSPIPSPPPFPLVGSTTLKPEQIVSYDIGYQGWWIKHRLRVRADLFFNHISDLISFVTVGTTRTFSNGGVADIYGGEIGAEFLATQWLSGFVNASYQEIGQTFVGAVRRGAPAWKVNVGLRGEWDNGLSGEATAYYVSSATYPVIETYQTLAPFGATVPNSRVNGYALLSLRGAYKFWKQKAAGGYLREAEIAVSALNALNDKHTEHPLGDVIGSRVMGWLTVRL